MSINHNLRAKLLGLAVIVVALAVGGAVVQAQTAGSSGASVSNQSGGPQGITFPIPELGNCANQADCKTYCGDSSHIDACTAFAESRGLMNKDEAARAKKFGSILQSGGGPGGCTSPDACEKFCSNIQNIDTCVAFAQKNGAINDQELAQAKKISAYLKTGGQMPGGCTSKESCRDYCGDFSHAKECYDFAQKSGITQQSENNNQGNNSPSPDQLKKLADLAAQGQTPGGCTTKDQCETYCKDSAHRDECIAFGKKLGLINDEQEKSFRATGGKGPGGCDSNESCSAYCNDPAHRDECYKFAVDNGFIKQEDADKAKQGMIQMRAGLSNAPPEVVACLQSAIGPNVINDIQSGKLVPGPEVGDAMRSCFDKFGQKQAQNILQGMPQDVLKCVSDKLGSDTLGQINSGKTSPTPEMADAVRVCFQSKQIMQTGPRGQNGGSPPNFQNLLQTIPQQVADCLRGKLGADFEKLQSGDTSNLSDAQDKLRGCFESFRPQDENNKQRPQDQGTMGPQGGFPPGIGDCVRQVAGQDAWNAVQQGQPPSDAVRNAIQGCMQRPISGTPQVLPGQNSSSNPAYPAYPVYPTTDQAKFCVEHGGTWNSSNSICTPPSPMPSGVPPLSAPPYGGVAVPPASSPPIYNAPTVPSSGGLPPSPPPGTATTAPLHSSASFESFFGGIISAFADLLRK